jgi:hypothetical protein
MKYASLPCIDTVFQVWTVSLPLTILNSPSIARNQNPKFGTAADIIGLIIWIFGWLLESQADIAKVPLPCCSYPLADSLYSLNGSKQSLLNGKSCNPVAGSGLGTLRILASE